MATSKARKMTFRQRLRAQSEERLDVMACAMADRCRAVCEEIKTEISPYDVMRLLTTGLHKSLRYRLVTELANEAEAELEALYNRQMNLLEEDSDGE